MYRKAISGAVLALAATAAQAEFTGDVKLACEAILCLSSGNTPSQCQPSLSRYFGIQKKKMSDTIEARLDFLNLCPTASHDDNMKNLVKAIANGAGRCDADYLNQVLARTITVTEKATGGGKWVNGEWTQNWTPLPEGYYCSDWETCRTREIVVIDNNKPGYCQVYQEHAYTYQVGAYYVGAPMTGGRWLQQQ